MKEELTQSKRRFIAIAFMFCFLISLTMRLFAPEQNLSATAFNILGFVFIGLLVAWGKNRINPSKIDERQRDIRNQGYFRCYLILSILALSIPLLMVLLFLISEATARAFLAHLSIAFRRPVDFVSIFATLAPFIIFLPWAMIAWLEPDPIQDDIKIHGEFA